LFSLTDKTKHTLKVAENAIYSLSKPTDGFWNGPYGPTFGVGHDLHICKNFSSNSNYSNLG